jgi:hypothetical protein
VNQPQPSYLLPCDCGRNIAISPRQAGETVRCDCGQTRIAPNLGEIRRLRPAEKSQAPTVSRAGSSWGAPERLLLLGIVLVVIAVASASVLAWQYPSQKAIEAYIQQRHAFVQSLGPWDSLQLYRRKLAPGVDAPNWPNFYGGREILAIGLAIIGILGAAGVVLVVLGAVGLSRKKK